MAKPKKAQQKGKRAKPPGKRGGKRRTSWQKDQPDGSPTKPPKSPGRPPLPEDYKLAMGDLGPRGLRALEAILDDPAHPRHQQTAEYIVNRWKGTPTARTEISAPGGGPVAIKTVLTSDEKRRRISELTALAAARIAQGKKKAGNDGPGGSD